MNIKFNIEKSQRKALAQKIGELAEMDVRYCGVPSCAYQIGAEGCRRQRKPESQWWRGTGWAWRKAGSSDI